MKVIASIPAYKEGLFLDYAIQAVYPYVDHVIITHTAMQSSLDIGCGHVSGDGTEEIIQKWSARDNVHVLSSKSGPKTFLELMQPALNLAKQLKGDWLFTVGADEIWTKQSLMPMKTILTNCDKNGILGLNVWMYIFAPDFWHYKDFRNPRFARITEDCELSWGDSMRWRSKGVYQFAGNTIEPYPPGTPAKILAVNSDYPRNLRAFHYSCVGKERIQFKYDFYKKFDGSSCDKYVESYINKNWEKFKELGFKDFKGKHPDNMLSHPLHDERVF
jgi:hypothetical protein